MNAPESAVAVASLPLAQIAPSPTNPRKHFDKAYIDELAASIQTHGVIQPITVRPLSVDGLMAFNSKRRGEEEPPLYEIVVGECRWRAAKQAGLAEIPAFWRELSDRQVVEIQLVENLKRRDLSALEEAQGYRRLMKEHGHTADTIAAQIGKSRSHVYAQLKLLECGEKARAALADGRLDPSRALLIARIPTEKLQEEALDRILGGKYQEPMSYRRAAEHVQEHYMLRLAEAPFPRGDADLVAGSPRCHDCPKRTGSQPELFADVKSADVCTDPACFAAKKAAHAARMLAEAEARGQTVITGKAAEKLKPSRYHDIKGDYLALDDHCPAEGARYKTYRELLGKKAPPPTLLEDPHEPGKLIEILPKNTIQEHLEAKGINLSAKRPANEEQKKRERKAKQETAWRDRLFDAIRSHLTQDFAAVQREPNLDDIEHRWVAEAFFAHLSFDAQKRLARLWIGPTDKKQDDHALIADFREGLPGRPTADHGRLLIEMALVGDTFVNAWQLDRKPERLLEAAQAYDIDADAIKKEVADEFRAKEKAKKPTKKPSPPTSAAQAKSKAAPAAAPAKAKKPAAAKKPKAKADPAPASPAEGNEPAAPAEKTKKAKPKLTPQQIAEAVAGPVAPVQGNALASQAWPFPTGGRL